jgi:hypothetical protein
VLSQVGPNFDVFSIGIFPALLPAILIGGALYFAVSLTQGRASFRTESGRGEPGPAGEENPVLGTLYALALAVLIAAFVGFGAETIYPAPETPQDTTLSGGAPTQPPDTGSALPGADTPSGAPDIGPGASGDAAIGAYEQELNTHDQVASVLAVVAAVLILVAGLTSRVSRLPVIGDGVTLGGVLTLLYGMFLAAQAPSQLLGFFVVAVGLIALLATLYLKFRPGRTTSS